MIKISADGGKLKYIVLDSDASQKFQDQNEKLVYTCIQKQGNKGIWTKDLRSQTTLHHSVLLKVLKNLENRKLVKAIKNVKNQTRKLYILYDLEPSADITGGPWFSENELDLNYIEELSQICLKFILSKSCDNTELIDLEKSGTNSEALWDFIVKNKISKTELSLENIRNILEKLVYDGKLKNVSACNLSLFQRNPTFESYIRTNKAYSKTLFSSTVCSKCKVFNACEKNCAISSCKCNYFPDFLQ